MAPEQADPLLAGVILVLALASFVVWILLFDRITHGPILAYEPRRPVPWHGAWTLLPIAMVVLTIASAISNDVAAPEAESASPTDMIERIAVGSAMQSSLILAFLAVVFISSGATRTDLGLPKDSSELGRDIRIGVIAWLAALGPVYVTQLTLLSMFGPSEGHPLLKMVEEQSSPALLILAFIAAVVAAPICEEFTFRLVLQGWLEKWDARRLAKPADLTDAVELSVDHLLPIEGETAEDTDQTLPSPEIETPRYSWTPIVISSFLFAMAHFGYGPDPVPLFLLALILGYIYQRTHRIVPAIVAHALFNGMSLLALWRFMSAGGQ